MPLPYKLSTSQAADGYLHVNGRPHGFKWEKQFEVTYKFASKEQRTEFIRAVKRMDKNPLESDDTSG
jgi:hypothetical protein